MTSRRTSPTLVLILLLCPTLVVPQLRFLKTIYCVVWSESFVFAGCAPCERLLCRLLAYRINRFCNSFPCTNYGAPIQHKCALPPFGCAPWNIKPLGLCQPFKFCCAIGGNETDKSDNRFIHTLVPSKAQVSRVSSSTRKQRGKKLGRKISKTLNKRKVKLDLNKKHKNNAIHDQLSEIAEKRRKGMGLSDLNVKDFSLEDFIDWLAVNKTIQSVKSGKRAPLISKAVRKQIPRSPQEYLKEWPEYDMEAIEGMIWKQFEKIMEEIDFINAQDVPLGSTKIELPDYQEFCDVALGNKQLKWSIFP